MAHEQTIVAVSGAISTILPSIISLVQALFVSQHPDLPPPTSMEVLMALNATVTKTLATDDFWLTTRPKE